MKLDELRSIYALDREALKSTAMPDPPPNICRYCRRYRNEWHGTKLDGHAKCMISSSFSRLLYCAMRADYRLTFKSVAEALDMSPSVTRAWYLLGERERVVTGIRRGASREDDRAR